MTKYVLDEWIFHDMWGQNGPVRKRCALQAVHWLATSGHQIVVPRGSPWTAKVSPLYGAQDQAVRLAGRLFFEVILVDSNITQFVETWEYESLECEIVAQTPIKDRYLVAAYLIGRADVLVTTDTRLKAALAAFETPFFVDADTFYRDHVSYSSARGSLPGQS